MAKLYTIEQLQQLFEFALNKQVLENNWKEVPKFLNLLRTRELALLPPRDEKGQFIHRVSNEDIYELIKKKVTKT